MYDHSLFMLHVTYFGNEANMIGNVLRKSGSDAKVDENPTLIICHWITQNFGSLYFKCLIEPFLKLLITCVGAWEKAGEYQRLNFYTSFFR